MPADDLLARFRRPGLGGRPRRRPGLAWALAPLALLALWGLWIEPSRLVERRPALAVDGLPPMTLALLSDVHAGSAFVDEARLREVVARINAARPDVVALLGDYVTEGAFATPIPPRRTAALLGALRAPGGVFAVLGNHDGEWVGGVFAAAGIRVLDGEVAAVTARGAPLTLLGVPDELTRSGRIAPSLARAPASGPIIALTHSPDVFPRVPAHVALTVAGHTHGGQVRLPLVGSPVVPSRFGQRYASGHVHESGHHLYVTTGLGMSILPVRLGVPPEYVLLRINGG